MIAAPFRKGDKIIISHDGKEVPGWVEIASDNNVSLYVRYDYMKHETMIAGCIGGLPLLLVDGKYRLLFDQDTVIEITRAQ